VGGGEKEERPDLGELLKRCERGADGGRLKPRDEAGDREVETAGDLCEGEGGIEEGAEEDVVCVRGLCGHDRKIRREFGVSRGGGRSDAICAHGGCQCAAEFREMSEIVYSGVGRPMS
jgi:hypothetical protein